MLYVGQGRRSRIAHTEYVLRLLKEMSQEASTFSSICLLYTSDAADE